ncbi:unnamed protein product [Cunninghamella blakesleeana]
MNHKMSMKTRLASSSFLFFLSFYVIMVSMVQAVPLTKQDPFPLIPSRIEAVKIIPPYDLSLEDKAGLSYQNDSFSLPKDIPTKEGFTLEPPKNLSLEIPSSHPMKNAIRNNDELVYIAKEQHVNEAYLYSQLAASAYCKRVVPLGLWFCPHCKSAVNDAKIEKTFFSLLSDTNGYIITSASQKAIFLAFRGTNSIRSAIVDLNALYKDYPPVKGAKVHSGFYKSYIDVQNKVLTTIQSLLKKYPDYRVDVTGHSLGGAQAELATLDLYQRFEQLTPKNLNLYTVGQPRVGDPAFAAYVLSTKINKIRIVNKSDIVPHLPPMRLGYLHTGVEHWIKDGTSRLTQRCESTYESSQCSNSVTPYFSILDHLSSYDIVEGICI